jgi:hypothetical protein
MGPILPVWDFSVPASIDKVLKKLMAYMTVTVSLLEAFFSLRVKLLSCRS